MDKNKPTDIKQANFKLNNANNKVHEKLIKDLEGFNKCMNQDSNNFQHISSCDIGFRNSYGVCWYNAIISILLFSDKTGHDFQKKLFTMKEEDIQKEINDLIELKKNKNMPVVDIPYLQNVFYLLISLKRRLCNIIYNKDNEHHDDIQERQ
jgi:hypothetical protein